VSIDGVGIGMPWQVSAFQLPAGVPEAAELVARIRELRARILFDGGRRPDFRDGEDYVDDQELDFGAWHFVGRREADGPPVGYVRLSTPQSARLFQSRAFLGDGPYEDLLTQEGLGIAETFEHSRLVVEHRARKLGLGVYLNAMAIAAARCLGAKAMTGTSGTADGQDLFHERFGFRPVPGTRRYMEHYTEDVVLMLYRAARGAGEYTKLVEHLEQLFSSITTTPEQALRNLPRTCRGAERSALRAPRPGDPCCTSPGAPRTAAS
jgi:predicted GNAT family N-acyltransferase